MPHCKRILLRLLELGRQVCVLSAVWQCSFAQAQYSDPACFVGDLNWDLESNPRVPPDNLVNNADLAAWDARFSAGGPYAPRFDLNRNGVLDLGDRGLLQRAIQLASPSGGLGHRGRIPAFTISEFRSGVPDPLAGQQRFIEFRRPTTYPPPFPPPFPPPTQPPPPDAFIPPPNNGFTQGVYLLLIAKGNSTSIEQGFIKKVFDLSQLGLGVRFATAGPGEHLALLHDSSFTLPIPPGFPSTLIQQPLVFQYQQDFNVTWMLVYTRPGVTPAPAVGRRVDLDRDCTFDQNAPWDLILDLVSVDASLQTTGQNGQGCIYGGGPFFEVEPLQVNGAQQSALHVYRDCGNNKEVRGFDQEVRVGIDTPGGVNCSSTPDLYCGSPDADPCDQPHPDPFCSDLNCCQYVCQVKPDCCTVSWEQSCVNLAGQECGKCDGLGTGSCLYAGSGGACNDEPCCNLVVGLRPECATFWDQTCADLAILNCLACGATVVPNDCYTVSPFAFCQDALCCSTVCIVDPLCCQVRWDESCILNAGLFCPDLACGSAAAGDCCLSHGTPFCNDAQCCSLICQLDPFCCNGRWDFQCVDQTLQFCTGLSCPCGGGGPGQDCFVAHLVPGCNSSVCCNEVCNSDPFCCGVEWDQSCVAAARSFCATDPSCEFATGSCTVPHATPGCADPSCCSAVCAVLQDCCDLIWDQDCVDSVPTLCGGCGDVFAESCCEAHGTPFCDDALCCNSVCGVDPFCCSTSWDKNCADEADSLCQPLCGVPAAICNAQGPSVRGCFVASFLRGCGEASCCEKVCQFDPFCCVQLWDSMCVQQALTLANLGGLGCQLPQGAANGQGDCLSTQPQHTGCSDVDCAAAVCSIEPTCCNNSWEQPCVDIAEVVCVTVGGCPGTESPFLVHPSPGSFDPSCCNAVCYERPECCSISWDLRCVTLANVRCVPSSQWLTAKCIGSCVEVHPNPGCDDEACASAVCFYDAQCCNIEWDETCVLLARGICCGFSGCGSPCEGSCLEVHPTPFCSDPFCCSTVCAVDSYCCETGWDSFCVQTARERCAGCGSPESGSCLEQQLGPGCSNARCCLKVCTIDAFCCDTVWDQTCADIASSLTTAQQGTGECDPPAQYACGFEGAGDCCVASQSFPFCRDQRCCAAVCVADPYCCDMRWDEFCVDEALASTDCNCLVTCGDPCSGPCCEAHDRVACNDLACCTDVCAADAFCCETQWDQNCAKAASSLCTGTACPLVQCGDLDAGDCCSVHSGVACSTLSCCALVCAADPFCCTDAWDLACVTIANGVPDCQCDGGCGDPSAGSCFNPHTTGYCDIFECCEIVCGKYLPECCSVAWDESCVLLALTFCQPGFTGDEPKVDQAIKPVGRLKRK